jgi:hypothetical protein
LFYHKCGLRLNPKGIVFPEYQPDFDVSVVHPDGMTRLEATHIVCKQFSAHIGFDRNEILGRFFSTPEREPTENSPILARNRPDESNQLSGTNFNMLRENGVFLMTLPECLLLAVKYIVNTGTCPYVSPEVVLNGGSVDAKGNRPYVYTKGDPKLGNLQIHVSCYKPDRKADNDFRPLWPVIVPDVPPVS